MCDCMAHVKKYATVYPCGHIPEVHEPSLRGPLFRELDRFKFELPARAYRIIMA